MTCQTPQVVVGQRFVGNGLVVDRADGPGLPPTPEGLSSFGIIADIAGEAFVAKDRVDQPVVGRQRAAVDLSAVVQRAEAGDQIQVGVVAHRRDARGGAVGVVVVRAGGGREPSSVPDTFSGPSQANAPRRRLAYSQILKLLDHPLPDWGNKIKPVESGMSWTR